MDFVIILVLFYLYAVVFSAASRKKREKRKARREERRSARRTAMNMPPQAFAAKEPEGSAPAHEHEAGEGEDPCHEGMLRPARPAVRVPEATPSQLAASGEGEDPCHEGMLRPARSGVYAREATASQFTAAGEGEDPCHAFAPITDEQEMDAPQEESLSDEARALLSGVILSEVLTSPRERILRRRLGMR